MNHKTTGEVLLDTHVWVWLVNGDDALKRSPAFVELESAAADGRLRIAAISVWELGMLEAKGRVTMWMNCLDWVERALAGTGISTVPLSPHIAIESSRLPHAFHGDPADRMIVATARDLGATLATRDKAILDYGKRGHVRVLAV